jgi:transposase-like protein
VTIPPPTTTPSAPDAPELTTTTEVARAVGVCSQTIRTWVKEGRLQVVSDPAAPPGDVLGALADLLIDLAERDARDDTPILFSQERGH